MISESISNDILHQIEIVNMVIPILKCTSNIFLQKDSKNVVASRTTCQPVKSDFKFATVCCSIYCRKFMKSNQMLRYICKCLL